MSATRLPGVDKDFLSRLRASLEPQLTADLANLPSFAPAREIYGWAALANDYRNLAMVAYAAGDSPDECRRLLRECARAHLEMVKRRGNGAAREPGVPPPAEYATGNSWETFVAVCMALAACDWDLAANLAPWIWDPPNQTWLAPNSVICTTHQRQIAKAMKEFLLGDPKAAELSLGSMRNIREDVIGDMLMLRAIVLRDRARLLKGLGLALSWHRRMAEAEDFDPVYFMATTALGLASMALHEGLIASSDLPSGEAYFSNELIACAVVNQQ